MRRSLAALDLLLAVAGCGGDDAPAVPVATLLDPGAVLSGEAPIDVVVSDRESRLVNLSFFHGTAPAPATPATAAATSPTLTGLATSPAGVTHRFIWSTVADLGYTRLQAVVLRVAVTAGAGDGIGDELGPLTVDNTGLPRHFSISGDVYRASVMGGDEVADKQGKLYLTLYAAAAMPGLFPTGAPLSSLDLGTVDLAATTTRVPFLFGNLEPGAYKLIALLDHNDNATDPSLGFAIDPGDMTNPGGAEVPDLDADTSQDVVLSYTCTLPACPP
jgi:hypothetical protein